MVRMGSKVGLIFALAGGALYIANGVTTSVSTEALRMIDSFISMQFPSFSSYLIPIVQWLTGLGGVGVMLGGVVAYFGFKEYGGYIIILSALGGIISYGTLLYSAQQSGLLSQPFSQASYFLVSLGPGFAASLLSVLAYLKR